MKTRRTFLHELAVGSFGLLSLSALGNAFGGAVAEKNEAFKGTAVFDRILAKALQQKWQTLSIGQCMGHVAREFLGTPYVGFTLELSKDREICSVNLTGLDCVTFFEDTLDFSRMLKKGGRTPEAMLDEIRFTRYRGGKLGDFTSRLHYTTDWFYDNQKKKVVELLCPNMPGAEPFTQQVGIMSQHPENYRQLVAHPELIPKIHHFEDEINSRHVMMYIPLHQLKNIEHLLQTGDIVGVCTNSPGTDICHTGLIYKMHGVAHFMDASSAHDAMKVTLEHGPIHKTLNWSKDLTGAMFARPLEPMSSAAVS